MTVTIDSGPATSDGIKQDKSKITTIIFDVDDTLYDVGTVSVSLSLGSSLAFFIFAIHRNYEYASYNIYWYIFCGRILYNAWIYRDLQHIGIQMVLQISW